MAAVLPIIEEILAGGGGVAGIAGRGVLGALVGFAIGDILNALSAHPAAKAHAHFALVDLKNDGKTVAFLSTRRAYRLLTRPRGRSRTRKVVVVNTNGEQTTVR